MNNILLFNHSTMKKILSFLVAAAALLTVSCNNDADVIDVENGPLASISFTVNSAEIMTKADPGYGQATAINELLVQVFNKVGDDFVKLEAPDVTITPLNSTPASWTVDMKLAKNETYKIAFWAQKSETGIYGTSDLSAVTVDYSKIAINNDDADAFCAARLVTVTGSLSQTVYLYRPLAQINIGTNDLAAYEKSVPTAKKNLTATITLPVETPNKLNVIGGTESEGVVKSAVTGTTTEEVVFTTAPSYVMSDQTLTSSNVDYSYLTMLYVLAAPGKETMTFKAKLNNGTTDVSDLTVSNMPYQANYRTNIVGQLLTGSVQYLVEIEEGFYADYEKIVSPTFATLAEMNDYLAILQDGTPEGDNGDINPEQVTLTALGDVTGTPQIVLPKINGGVDIRLAFDYDGTVEMVYADPADGAKKPANIFFYAQKLKTLVATVPQSHFELLSGSIVTNKAIVATNTNTFVIQNGARVGTAEIQKGNASIAGTVTTVSVPTGATADGTNAVQVFLEKVSSVDQIVLNAKTDVVVEQPKDQIEVEATERKVAVYVNEGADNSSATAQNGGVIYVKATVPCTVTADGTSEAEDGSAVASTVIIEPGADGSAVVAENGGSIVLTANDNCAVVSQGVSDDPTPVPSNVTVTSATSPVSATTSDEGTVTTTSSSQDNVTVVEDGVALIGAVVYQTLTAAFAAAVPSDVVKILKDYNASNEPMSAGTRQFVINKSITIDGQGHTVQTKNRGFGVGNVNNNLSSNIDVTFKDITILNPTNGGRCIDTRGKIGVLTLDNVVLSTQGATGQYTQPLTIGGNQSDIASININNSTIQTNEDATAYYAIITFNPVNMTISNSTIKGWACIYAKGPDSSAGSAGSTFTVTSNSNLVSYNCYSGVSNAFSAVEIEDSNVTVDITDSNIAIHNSGDQIQSIFGFPDFSITGCNLSLIGNNIDFDNTGSGSCALIVNQGSNTLVYSDNTGLIVGSGASVIDNGDEF